MMDTLLPSTVFSLLAQAESELRSLHTILAAFDNVLADDLRERLSADLRTAGTSMTSLSMGAGRRRTLITQLGALIAADMMLQRELVAKRAVLARASRA